MDNLYWIKLHRQIRESAIWDNDEPFDYRSAWLDLIMEAHTKSNEVNWRGNVISVKRGDVYTSIRKLAGRWHWSTGKVTRFLKILEKLGMIRRHRDIKCVTLLTIVNYGKFQDKQDSDGDTNDTLTRQKRDRGGVLLKNNKNKDIKIKEKGATSLPEEAPAPEEEEEEITDEMFEAMEDI